MLGAERSLELVPARRRRSWWFLIGALAMGSLMGFAVVGMPEQANVNVRKQAPAGLFGLPFAFMSVGMFAFAWMIARAGAARVDRALGILPSGSSWRFRFRSQEPMQVALGVAFFMGLLSHFWMFATIALTGSKNPLLAVAACVGVSVVCGFIALKIAQRRWRSGACDFVIDNESSTFTRPTPRQRERRPAPLSVPLARVQAVLLHGNRLALWLGEGERWLFPISRDAGLSEHAFDAGRWIAEQLGVPFVEPSQSEVRRWRQAQFPMLRKRLPFLVYVLLVAASIGQQNRKQLEPPPPLPQGTLAVNVPALETNGRAVGPDVSLAYREWHADGLGVPVMLLHGSPGSAQDFDGLAPLIDSNHRVIAPDMLGYGGTRGHIDDRSIKAYARIMLAMMDRLHIEKVHVVGWSNGGGVALHMADLAPDRIVSITMLASIGLQEHEPSGSYEFEHFKYKAAKVIFGGLPELLPHFGLLGTYDRRTAWADFFDDSDQRELKGVMERIGASGMPALILHGRHDFLVPWFAAEDHYRLIASSRLVMLDASHFIPFLQEKEASGVLNEWFASIERDRAEHPHWRPTKAELGRRLLSAQVPTTCPWRAMDIRDTPPHDNWIHLSALYGTAAVRSTPWWTFLLATVLLALRWRVATVVFGCILVLHCWLDPFLLLSGVIASGLIRVLMLAVRTRRKARTGVDRPPHVLISMLAAIFWPIGAMVVAIALDRFALASMRHLLGEGILGVVGVLITPLAMALSIVVVMGLCSRDGRHRLRVSFDRLINHEYWPTQAFYFPFYPRFLWMALRNGGVRQVTCCNPEIENGGGWAGESKVAIMDKLAPAGSVVLPTYLVPVGATALERAALLRDLMERHTAIGEFPIVLKPNEAQRGHAFKLARSMEQAEQYLSEMTAAAVAQPYHAGPEECGIFWMRYSKKQLAAGTGPDGRSILQGRLGFIYSVTRKEFPRVTGDGSRTLEQLVKQHPRYRRQAAVFLSRFANDASRVPARGEEVRLAISGNHCQGTLFRDGADLITPDLEAEVDRIARVFPRLDYGRFDVRFSSEDELKQGRGMAIIELNGSSSEPTNMYDPDRSYFWALGVLARMWQQVLELAKERRAEGVKPLTVRQFIHLIRENAKSLKGSSVAD